MEWKATFRLKDLLTPEDVEPETARGLAATVLERLQGGSPFSLRARSELATWFNDVDDQELFNEALDVLYSIADAERIWVE
jgi:hypothetical protein